MCSDYCSKSEAKKLNIELCDLNELLQKSTIISLHKTFTQSTRGLIGAAQLKKIQDGALFVNTARGSIVQEAALIDEVKTGRFFVALDVYDKEPLSKDSPLLQLSNVICTPHIGGFSRYWKTRLGECVVDDLERFIKGEPLQGRIDHDKFRRLTTC